MKKRKYLNAYLLTLVIVIACLTVIPKYFKCLIENTPVLVLSILGLIILAMIGFQIKNRIKEYKENPQKTIKNIKNNLISGLIIFFAIILFFVIIPYFIIFR